MAEKLEFVIGAKDKFSGSFGKLQSALPGIGRMARNASIAFAGLGASVFAMVKTTATAYDKVQKLSDRLGIATEALSKMHYAAELSGVSTETVNMALQRMTRRVAESSQGLGVATKALQELHLSAKDLATLAPDEQFMKIAEAMDGVASQSDKVRLAFALFDSEGVSLVQTMKDGSAGLKDMMDEAEKFGLVISEEAGKNAAAFNDSLTRLIGSMKGLKNHFSEDLLPIFTKGFNNLADLIANNRDKILSFGKSFLSIMGTVAEGVMIGVGYMIDAWRGLQMIWEVLKIGGANFGMFLIETLDRIIEKVVAALEAMNYKGMLDGMIAKADSLYTANQGAMNAFYNMLTGAEQALEDLIAGGSAVDKAKELADIIKNLFTGEDGSNGATAGLPKPEDVAATLEEIATLESDSLDDRADRNRNFYEMIRDIAQIEADQEKLIAQQKSDDIQNIMSNLYSAMGALGKDYFELMKNVQTVDAIIQTYSSAVKAYNNVVLWGGPVLAAVAAAAAIVAGMANVARIRAQTYPSAHGGMSNVPKEQTYLLDAGERVLSPKQNQDLKDFMSKGSGATVTGNNFNLSFPNTDLSSMSKSQVEDFTEQKLAPALKKLALQGLY